MTYKLMLLTAAAALVVGCGQPQQQPTGKVFSGALDVQMKNLKYVPATFTVQKGTAITFVNKDAMTHNVVQVSQKELGKVEPGFISDVIDPGKSWTITLDKPGTYPILCTEFAHFTAGMVGTITVVE